MTTLDLLQNSQDHLPAALGGCGQAAALALALYCAHRTPPWTRQHWLFRQMTSVWPSRTADTQGARCRCWKLNAATGNLEEAEEDELHSSHLPSYNSTTGSTYLGCALDQADQDVSYFGNLSWRRTLNADAGHCMICSNASISARLGSGICKADLICWQQHWRCLQGSWPWRSQARHQGQSCVGPGSAASSWRQGCSACPQHCQGWAGRHPSPSPQWGGPPPASCPAPGDCLHTSQCPFRKMCRCIRLCVMDAWSTKSDILCIGCCDSWMLAHKAG